MYVVCRQGNDSQLAVELLRKQGEELDREGEEEGASKMAERVIIRDIVGGLNEWTESIDPLFPKY